MCWCGNWQCKCYGGFRIRRPSTIADSLETRSILGSLYLSFSAIDSQHSQWEGVTQIGIHDQEDIFILPFIHCQTMVGVKPLKLKKIAAMRWLSIFPAIERIASQYNFLKAYFRQEHRDHPDSYSAQLLSGSYEDLVLKAEPFFSLFYFKTMFGKLK